MGVLGTYGIGIDVMPPGGLRLARNLDSRSAACALCPTRTRNWQSASPSRNVHISLYLALGVRRLGVVATVRVLGGKNGR